MHSMYTVRHGFRVVSGMRLGDHRRHIFVVVPALFSRWCNSDGVWQVSLVTTGEPVFRSESYFRAVRYGKGLGLENLTNVDHPI